MEPAAYPDGELASVPLSRLAARVGRLVTERRPSHLLVFDTTGVTGHRDHRRAPRRPLPPPVEGQSRSSAGPCRGRSRRP
ncbi:hypothetical protein [Streptomyces sp. NPDC050548]|uniref:hypothetical protein n=1 Tax=Streptomyces sp. NPDC050548 TaxID=3365629 RepID=UPI00379B1E20